MQQLRRSRGSSAAKPIAAWLSGLERSKVVAQAPPPAPVPREKHALPSQAALDSVQALAAELEPSPLRSALEAMAARQKRDLRSRG